MGAEVCVLAFASGGETLASADAVGKIFVWSIAGGEAKLAVDSWTFHTARVTSLSWFADGSKLVSGSLDQHMFVWNADAPDKKTKITEVHRGGVSGVAAGPNGTVSSVGHDG